MNATSFGSVGNSRGSNIKTETLLLRPGQFFGIARIFGKRYNSFRCAASGFVAAYPAALFSALVLTVAEPVH